MDQDRFDRLARSLARSTSRRSVIMGGVAAAAAGVLGGRQVGAAPCRGPAHRCATGADCCSGICADFAFGHRKVCDCPEGQVPTGRDTCGPAAPSCDPGTTLCQDHCVDLQTDPANCGDCGIACAEGRICRGGQCVVNCDQGESACGAGCCPADRVCCDGACCDAGQQCLHGSCGTACAVAADACGESADCCDGLTCCGGACVDLASDDDHCGDCDAPCGADQSCDGGNCRCADGIAPCGAMCCGDGTTCVDGQCQASGSGVCPVASRCGSRQYCSDDQTCICVQSAEGDNRCGKIPTTCYVDLCQTSADCAHLGEGYFCDTPNSGCCTDPPSELPRCVAPCEAPTCPADRTCGDTCCPPGQICAEGQCVGACTSEADCDDGNSCTIDTCDPNLGCQHAPVTDGTPCDNGAGTCQNGTCVRGGGNACDGSSCFGDQCGSEDHLCICTSSVEGVGFCLDAFKADCDSYQPCSASSDCPDGLCVATAGCCGGVNLCVPPSAACPTGTGAGRPRASARV